MFSRAKPERGAGEASEPLLQRDAEENEHEDDVLFSVADDGDEASESGSDIVHTPNTGVRFQERVDVRVYAPEWSQQSREAEFEHDSDELDDAAIAQLEHLSPPNGRGRGRGRRREQTQPLLVGLLDASSVRRADDVAELDFDPIERSDPADVEELARRQHAGGGLANSIANMANSILGAGIIGLPYAVSRAGFVTGLLLLTGLCAVTDWTIRLIVLNAKLSGTNSYIAVMHRCFGQSGRAAVSFFQFAFAFGGMCAFGIIIGDTIPHVLRQTFPGLSTTPVLSLFANRQFVIAFCTLTVSYPLSLNRDIHKLSFASFLALIGMGVIVFTVLVRGPTVPDVLRGDPSKRWSIIEPGAGFFNAIGVISFAYVCHHNTLLIYGSLKVPTLNRFAMVTHVSVALSLVACTTMAVAGYMVFTDKTQGNILNNFPLDDMLINIARFCFGLNMFTTLPLELFVCREVIEQYFFAHESFNYTRHLFFTTVILFSSTLLSIVTCDLGVMLEITGGVSATALAYIFPAACYIQLAPPGTKWTSWRIWPAAVCAAFGALVMVLSLGLALQKVWTSEGEARICM